MTSGNFPISEELILTEDLVAFELRNKDLNNEAKYKAVFKYFWETGNIAMKRKMMEILND